MPASHSQRGWGWGSFSLSAHLSGRRVKVPLVSPSHVGTECKDAVCRDGRAGGQGRWVHLPQRHQGSRGLSLSLPGRYSQSWSQRVRPRSCFSPEKGGPLSPAPAPGLEFPLLPACLWKVASPAPAQPAPQPPGQPGWALCWLLAHHLLKEAAVPCFFAVYPH